MLKTVFSSLVSLRNESLCDQEQLLGEVFNYAIQKIVYMLWNRFSMISEMGKETLLSFGSTSEERPFISDTLQSEIVVMNT